MPFNVAQVYAYLGDRDVAFAMALLIHVSILLVTTVGGILAVVASRRRGRRRRAAAGCTHHHAALQQCPRFELVHFS